MAQRIKFRLTAAKVGVSMALLALVGGVVEKVRGGTDQLHGTRASAQGSFLKVAAAPQKIQNEIQKVEAKIVKLEDKWGRLDTALKETEQKLVKDYYSAAKIRSTYLTAAKVRSTFLTIDAANGEFLKDSTAAQKYLKINAAKNEFIQGRGGVVSAQALVAADGSVSQLLKSSDGSITVSVMTQGSTGDLIIVVRNNTGELVPAVQLVNTTRPTSADVGPNATRQITLSAAVANHLQFQLLSNSTKQALTLVVSTEPEQSAAGGPTKTQVIAQMLNGGL